MLTSISKSQSNNSSQQKGSHVWIMVLKLSWRYSFKFEMYLYCCQYQLKKKKFQEQTEGTYHIFILRVSEPHSHLPSHPCCETDIPTGPLSTNHLFCSSNPISGSTCIIYGVMNSPFSPNQISWNVKFFVVVFFKKRNSIVFYFCSCPLYICNK